MSSSLIIEWKSMYQYLTVPNDLIPSQNPNADAADQTLVFQPQLEVSINHSTKIESNTTVFKGRMRSKGSNKYSPAVLKLLHHTHCDLGEQEAQVYQLPAVQSLQSHVVPRFYGYFHGYTRLGQAGCLLLQDAGEEILCRQDMNVDLRMKVMNAARQLHYAGLVHGRIPTHPLLTPDGSVFFVGLSVMKEMNCPSLKIPIKPGFPPLHSEFPCDELYRLACLVGVWRSVKFGFCGQDVDAKEDGGMHSYRELSLNCKDIC
ncbi:hypothetical protein C8Q75DRAFT_740277 [Abortiporus biennis]|nr:hypothetical protein C8Q75DRAFT_740277 [Abortiporus biennis]